MKHIRWLTITFLVAGAAFADTVYFKDGSSLDGVVSYPNEQTLSLDVGSGSMAFAVADVDRVEKNKKTSDPGKMNEIRAKWQQQALDKRTGMTDEQRDQVREMMAPLWSEDEGVRNEARRRLVRAGGQMPVFQYAETTLRYAKGTVAPELMQLLVDIDPKKAKEVLPRYTSNLDARVRARSLELMATYKDANDLYTIAGGTVDPDPVVRARAAHALASTEVKGATPALIRGLDDNEPTVQNASRAALLDLWGKEGASAELKTSKDWQAFWAAKEQKVKDAINPAELQPPVTAERLKNAALGNDE